MRGHGVKEQCVRGHFKEMATRARPYVTTATLARCKGSGVLEPFFFPGAYTVSSCDIDTLLARSSGKWPAKLGSYFLFLQEQIKDIIICARAPSLG